MALSEKAKLYLKAGLASNEVGEELIKIIEELESKVSDLEAAVEALENP